MGLTDGQIRRLEDASWTGGREAWLAEVAALVAEARAEALREAAADYGDFMYGWVGGGQGGTRPGGVPEWLRERADSVGEAS